MRVQELKRDICQIQESIEMGEKELVLLRERAMEAELDRMISEIDYGQNQCS